MHISNTEKVAKEIDNYQYEVEQRLKLMVAGFAREMTEILSRNTPIGDQASIEVGKESSSGPAFKYYTFYKNRAEQYGIDDVVGFHKGAYVYAESDSFYFNPEITEPGDTSSNAYHTAMGSYTIGETFYIGAKGPAYQSLESGKSAQAPEGISEPSLADMYKVDLTQLYNNTKG
jgi:hypothetical protein